MGKEDHGPDPVLLPFGRSQTPGLSRIYQDQAQEKALTPQVIVRARSVIKSNVPTPPRDCPGGRDFTVIQALV